MALSYKSRRGWALVVLVLELPAYIVAVISILGLLTRPPIWVEFCVYVGVGVIWALPFRFLFKGIGQPDPNKSDAPKRE